MTIAERLHEAVLTTETAGLTPMELENRMVEVFDDMEIDPTALTAELTDTARPAGLTPTTLIPIFKEWRAQTEADVLRRLHAPTAERIMESGFDPASERAHDDERAYDIYAEHDNRYQNGAA